ncbi:MAG: hypothetical protein M3042_13605 [Actinomycetota bacterium]|nr:hypothetical protein [Actinomycetota bacterium]
MAQAPRRRPRPGHAEPGGERSHDDERGLRGLVGAGPSQVGVSGALRARDASRPTEEDVTTAEQTLRVVRRNYVPPPSGPSGNAGTTPDRS